LARFERCLDQIRVAVRRRQHVDRLDLLAQTQGDAGQAHVVVKSLGDLLVEEAEDVAAPLDQRDADTEGGHDARVLAADDAAAHDNQVAGQRLQRQEVVGAENVAAVEGYVRRSRRPGADRDDEAVGGDALGLAGTRYLNHVRLEELRGPPYHLDAVAVEGVANGVELVIDHLAANSDQVADGDAALDAVAFAKEPALAAAGQMHGRFAQRLGGNGTGVDLGAANDAAPLDDGDALAELGSLNGRLLASRAGADNDGIVVTHVGTHSGMRIRP